MKKLPTSTTLSVNILGFTLVELLVVVSIIAILSVIGMAIFTGIQPRARDTGRKADLKAISSAMEVGYNESTGRYSSLADSMFSSLKIPTDPLKGASSCQGNICKYCVRTTAGNCDTVDPTVEAGQPPVGSTYLICANLEQGSPSYICEGSQR